MLFRGVLLALFILVLIGLVEMNISKISLERISFFWVFLLLLLNFASDFWSEPVYALKVLDKVFLYLYSLCAAIDHRNQFLRFYHQSKYFVSKTKFRESNNHHRRVLELSNLLMLIKLLSLSPPENVVLMNSRLVDHMEICGLFLIWSMFSIRLVQPVIWQLYRIELLQILTYLMLPEPGHLILEAFDKILYVNLRRKFKSFGVPFHVLRLISSDWKNVMLMLTSLKPSFLFLFFACYTLSFSRLCFPFYCSWNRWYCCLLEMWLSFLFVAAARVAFWTWIWYIWKLWTGLGNDWLVDFNAEKNELVDRSTDCGAVVVKINCKSGCKMESILDKVKSSFEMLGFCFISKFD